MKKKPVVVTIPDVREAPARKLAPKDGSGVSYPSAGELLASSSEWAKWLESAMRAVLRPAALAGAVGLAASGCANGEAAPPPSPWADASGDASGDTGVVMYALPSTPLSGTGAGGGVTRPPETHPPHPTQGGGSGTVVVSPLPDPPPVDGTHASVGPKPPIVSPSWRPPMVRGRIRPVAPDIPMPGGIRPVN